MKFALNFETTVFIVELVYMEFKAKRRDLKQMYTCGYFISNLDSIKDKFTHFNN